MIGLTDILIEKYYSFQHYFRQIKRSIFPPGGILLFSFLQTLFCGKIQLTEVSTIPIVETHKY